MGGGGGRGGGEAAGRRRPNFASARDSVSSTFQVIVAIF